VGTPFRSMASRSGAKHWCFTINNYTEEEYESLCDVLADKGYYWIAGREVGEGGTPHIQGYVSFSRRITLQSIRSLLSDRGHYEVARGSPSKNRAYCSKDGNFREGGEPPKEGGPKRTRDELAREFAGAHEDMPDAYIKEPRTKWWNGYLGEKEVIIDDFGPGGIDINHLLRWFDRYKCLVENKGGMIPLLADKFIVTSNFHPCEIFKWGDERHPQLPALERRCTFIHME